MSAPKLRQLIDSILTSGAMCHVCKRTPVLLYNVSFQGKHVAILCVECRDELARQLAELDRDEERRG